MSSDVFKKDLEQTAEHSPTPTPCRLERYPSLLCAVTIDLHKISPNQCSGFQAELWQLYFEGSHCHGNVSCCDISHVVVWFGLLCP